MITALDNQQMGLEDAQKALGCLEERLIPVLRNREGSEVKGPEPELVPLANRINDHNFMIARLKNVIMDICERLEI